MITVRRIPNHSIWHVESDDRWELAMTFLRIEEFYESPNPRFQGKVFTLEEYMDWYVQEYSRTKKFYGAFTYAHDWSAFNVPGHAVAAVRDTFAPHLAREQWLFQKLDEQEAFAEERWYLIGNRVGQESFFEHEFRHALWATNDAYREAMLKIVERYPVHGLRRWIRKRYAETSLRDEIHAYALTGWPKISVTAEMCALRRELLDAEREFIGGHKRTRDS